MRNPLARICLDAAFPLRCLHCETLYLLNRSGQGSNDEGIGHLNRFGVLMAEFLCRPCLSLFESVESPLCTHCGRPFASSHGLDHVCGDCEKHPFNFTTARAAGLYHQALKTAIHQFKYQGRSELARPLGRLLWDAFHRFYDAAEIDLVVPVPLHWIRRYRRGFNQAALLVSRWGGPDADPGSPIDAGTVCHGVLFRTRNTVPQTGLGKGLRAANLKNAFKVKNPQHLQGKSVLLVDDVLTTGATADACAKALKEAGAGEVNVLTLARAV